MCGITILLSPDGSLGLAGFYIHSVLLGGSTFDRQILPNTTSALVLSTVALLITFGMQFSLAWFLWINLPVHPRREGSLDPYPPALGSVWAAGPDDPKFSVCRTNSLIQIICLSVFLFYILNAVPGIIKNFLIVLGSDRFVSQDTDGVTRIHYWRSCSFWARLRQVLRLGTAFPHEMIDGAVLDYYLARRRDDPSNPRSQYFLPLSARTTPFPWTVDDYRRAHGKPDADWVLAQPDSACDEKSTRMFYEVEETRAFLRRKLAAVNPDTFAVDEAGDSDLQDVHSARAARALAADSGGRDEGVVMLGGNALALSSEDLERLSGALADQDLPARIQRTREAAEYLVGLDYCDGAEEAEVKRVIGGYGALRRSLVALLGVVAEGTSVLMLLICGIEYILWSGAKVASESNGIEEIILASLAIVFVNEIDEVRSLPTSLVTWGPVGDSLPGE